MRNLGIEEQPKGLFLQRDLYVVVERTVDNLVKADLDYLYRDFFIVAHSHAQILTGQLGLIESELRRVDLAPLN